MKTPESGKFRRVPPLIAAAAIILITAAFYLQGYRIAVNVSDSIGGRLFIIKKFSGDPPALKNGDKAVFSIRLPGSKYDIELQKRNLIKKVTCAGGEYLKREGDEFYCGGRLIAIVNKSDRRGEDYQVGFHFNGVIPEGMYFMSGTSPFSFDSRYFGLIDKSRLKGEVKCELF